VRESVKRRGQQINEDAARLLIDRIGSDISELDQEVEKICLFALNRRKTIGREEVEAAARMGHTANVFELGDAVGLQNPERALSALKDLLAMDHYMPILHMLIRHFRLLLKARVLMNRSIKETDAARALGVPPFVVRKYLDQARKLGMTGIKRGLASLLQANLTLISDPAPPNMVMEKLVLELATLRRNVGP
jgi:DNA polymerase-3 subunit delta